MVRLNRKHAVPSWRSHHLACGEIFCTPKTFRVLTCVFAFVSLIPTRPSASRQNFYCLPCVRLYLIQRNVSARVVAVGFLLVVFFFVARRRAFARVDGGFARRCVRGSTLGARLGAGCARRCVRGSRFSRRVCAVRFDGVRFARRCVCDSRFAQYFLYHTAMYFFALQIWLVVVTAQVTINAADAEALNQTLTGLGCWESSICKTQNFKCGGSGIVQCNANGLVTSL